MRLAHTKDSTLLHTFVVRKKAERESPVDGASMSVTTLTSREFNQDTSRAKKAAERGPVFITDRGRPAHVLLTVEDYQRLTDGNMSLREALAQPGEADFELAVPYAHG
jgi:prevent-host-death family protein